MPPDVRARVFLVLSALFTLAALAAAAASAPTASAEATSFTQRTVGHFGASFFNPCTGEEVVLQGTEVQLTHLTTDAHGGMHAKFNFTLLHVTGEASSGITYRQVGGQQENIARAYSDGAPIVLTIPNTVVLIGQGSADDLLVVAQSHVTVNANGIMVVEFFEPFVQECVG